jgi:hypothetical protein
MEAVMTKASPRSQTTGTRIFQNIIYGSAAVLAAMSLAQPSQAQMPEALPFDSPTMVGDVETVCTGIGQDAREDPRWNLYPLKVVLAGEGGQYLGEARLTIAKDGQNVVDVLCRGPWVLFKLNPGRYALAANVNDTGVKASATVSSKNQGRVVLRFPSIGGKRSPEHVPSVY